MIGTVTDYINGIQYDGTTSEAITFIQTEEGRALPNGTSAYNYEYSLGDNLGNTRITVDSSTGIARTEQQDNYLPFGMDISVGTIGSPQNKYLYNKKELQDGLGTYDYGARFYDPVIGRWTSPDLLAEVAPSLTPYRYCYNNQSTLRILMVYGKRMQMVIKQQISLKILKDLFLIYKLNLH